ncbi:MAG TPA: DUF2188 domain-containing protein [Longimicrobiales bacterium]|nr:DUF2188 domain-containing protein [Longimicrobiales bacterium]
MTLLKKKTTAERVATKVTKAVTKNPGVATAAGLAAATAVGAAAWLTTGRLGHKDGVALHVDTDENGGWLLRQEDTDEPISRHDSKRRAVAAARKFARGHRPSALTIHKKNGAVGRRHIYGVA